MSNLNLEAFCSTDKNRPSLHKPFSRGSFTYATDGRVLVRVPRIEAVPEQEKTNPEKLIEQYLKDEPRGALSLTLPENPKLIDCSICDGRGTEHSCPDCSCECPECHGVGEVPESTIKVGIGNAVYDAKYIRKITALPGLKFPAQPPQKEAAGFTFDGGAGLLMPMVYSKPDVVATVEIP